MVSDQDGSGQAPLATRPVDCKPDHQIAAREVERILRNAFNFPDALDAKVTAASQTIAVQMLVHSHRVTQLFYAPPQGSA